MNAVDSNEVTPVQKMNNVDSEKKTNDVTPVNASIIDTNKIKNKILIQIKLKL